MRHTPCAHGHALRQCYKCTNSFTDSFSRKYIKLIGLRVSPVFKTIHFSIQLAINTKLQQLRCVEVITITRSCFLKYLHYYLDYSSFEK